MARFNSRLDHVRVAAPCPADWDGMVGTDRFRFCGQCNLNVYNLSSMTRAEAESLIARTEGRLCVRFYRRTDGSILTRNCPVGLKAIRRRLSSFAKAATTLFLSFFAGLAAYRAAAELSVQQTHVMGVIAINDPDATPALDMGTALTPEVGGLATDLALINGEVERIPKKSRRRHR